MKKIVSILVLVLALLLVGCSQKKKSSDELYKDLSDKVQEYANATAVEAKITLVSDGVTQTIDVCYEIENSKIKSLATVLTDSDGVASVYVKDGVCYMSRYSSVKQKYQATDEELTKIANNYTLDTYIQKALDIFNKEFFKASSVDAEGKTSFKLTCDLESLQVSDDVSDEDIIAMEEQVEKLKAMESVELVLNYENKALKSLDGTFVKEGKTSTIKIEFISTSAKAVEVPNQSEYQNK